MQTTPPYLKPPSPNTQPVVLARGLTKRFGASEVVRGIDFDVRQGSCFGLLGPNGAGKTTTLRMILGISDPSGGHLSVFGEPVPGAGRAVRARMGVVPQIDNLDPDFTVVENLRIYASYFRLSGSALERRIDELIKFVELTEKRDVRIETLSGGMKRRLSIARALVNDPDLLILDEPTTGLDPQVRHMIWGRLRELKKAGKTLLLTTHYMEEAERLCDELIIMDKGSILERGSPPQLVQRHVESEVVELRAFSAGLQERLKAIPEVRAEEVGDTVYCYTRDGEALLERLKGDPDLVYLHRPGNLEDVFLKLTGHELRD
ncbi:MAG: ATP-binding cassette domain-containing protein [Proteobacteria bacterium]|nr:MAG: ATP-binding cassette domain-containing protein [Pseudomonadota bacterium]